MKLLIVLFFAIVATESLNDREEWIHFKNEHGINYRNSVEEKTRFTIFQDNLRKIEKQNEKFENGVSTFKFRVTKFADLTAEEFLDRLKMSKKTKPSRLGTVNKNIEVISALPTEVDWSKNGAVTEVKDQKSCGSCWSFSTTGTVEGAYFLSTGKLVSLSEQNLVDCAHDNCFGCEGGWMDKALEYIEQNGIMTENDYPYEGLDDSCRFNPSKSALKIANFTYVIKDDEIDLQKAVALKGPVAIAIDATSNFQLYLSGILDDDGCSSDIEHMNHGVLAVGYGVKDGKDYWIVKNSWGANWGMSGYIWMSRNKNNQCGIATDGTYATI